MVNPEEVDKLAQLARLELAEEQKVALAQDLNQVLEYVAQLQILKTKNLISAPTPTPFNVLRADSEPKATKKAGDFVRVKKIL